MPRITIPTKNIFNYIDRNEENKVKIKIQKILKKNFENYQQVLTDQQDETNQATLIIDQILKNIHSIQILREEAYTLAIFRGTDINIHAPFYVSIIGIFAKIYNYLYIIDGLVGELKPYFGYADRNKIQEINQLLYKFIENIDYISYLLSTISEPVSRNRILNYLSKAIKITKRILARLNQEQLTYEEELEEESEEESEEEEPPFGYESDNEL